MNKKFFAISSAVMMMTGVAGLAADSYRCGQKLILTGDSAADVLRVCGEPAFRDKGYERIKAQGTLRDSRVERWYYKKSRRSLGRVVIFYRGRVHAIEVGAR
jgi:hypothetical protein